MSWFRLKASWMSCTLASSIENDWPVTLCDPDDSIDRRIRSSDEKKRKWGCALVAMEMIDLP